MEHKQIVLRSFEVISRIDPIQIYNSTIEQQSTVIQPVPTDQSASLAIYLTCAFWYILGEHTLYIKQINYSTCMANDVYSCTVFIFLWGRCQLQTDDSVRVLAQQRNIQINVDNDSSQCFFIALYNCIWLNKYINNNSMTYCLLLSVHCNHIFYAMPTYTYSVWLCPLDTFSHKCVAEKKNKREWYGSRINKTN